MFNHRLLKNNSTTQKNFSYSKGKVTLSFNLRTDIKTDLKDFLELLEVATEGVKKEINL